MRCSSAPPCSTWATGSGRKPRCGRAKSGCDWHWLAARGIRGLGRRLSNARDPHQRDHRHLAIQLDNRQLRILWRALQLPERQDRQVRSGCVVGSDGDGAPRAFVPVRRRVGRMVFGGPAPERVAAAELLVCVDRGSLGVSGARPHRRRQGHDRVGLPARGLHMAGHAVPDRG